MSKKITDIECRFVMYGKDNIDKSKDYHYIKECIHYEDGTGEPNLRVLQNYERDFYVTKKGFQNHKEMKDFEYLDRLTKYKSTQCNMTYSVAKALGSPWFKGTLRDVPTPQYVYGADISTSAVIKYNYMKKWTKQTPWSSAVFDVETDVVTGDETIIIAALTMKDKVIVGVRKDFIQSVSNYESRLLNVINKYLGEYIKKRNIELVIAYVDNEIEILKHVFKHTHQLKPDVVTGWNIDFDIGKIEQACEVYNYPIKELLSDPSLKSDQKFYKYVKSPDMKVTASGRVQPVMNYDKWNYVHCPANFVWIDAMCMYRRARTGAQELKNYKLDTVLDVELQLSKLRIEGTDQFPHGSLDWHKYMQINRKLEYIAYNIFDCISVELLDEKTTDIAIKLPILASFSDLSYFHKQPKRTADKMHFDVLEQGYAIGIVSSDMYEDSDDDTVTRDGWVVMLPTHLNDETGLKCTQWPDHRTNIHVGCADSDVEGSYPSNQIAGNVSKITTQAEFVAMPNYQGDRDHMRRSLMDLLGGHVNAVTSMTDLHGLPSLSKLQELYLSKNK